MSSYRHYTKRLFNKLRKHAIYFRIFSDENEDCVRPEFIDTIADTIDTIDTIHRQLTVAVIGRNIAYKNSMVLIIR